jgi:ferric-dicitrate binding protein FerR (iron transport regulator)
VNKRIKNLIAKYFDEHLINEEAKELVNWIENGNFKIFNEYVMINFSIDEIETLKLGADIEIWKNISEKINHKGKKAVKLSYWKFAAIAASIAISITLSFVFNKDNSVFKNTSSKITKQPIVPGSNKAVLTLENGDHVTLEKGKVYHLSNRTSNGEKLVYNADESSSKEVQYNYLTIPRGGQFYVQLADGTKVWLNSESKLKYPLSFVKGATRKVELLYGEAYFNVSNSSNHNGVNFIVETKIQEVNVLGTEFNIKAYNDENEILTTLVEGEVSVSNGIVNKVLKPGNQSRVNIIKDNVSINKVNVANEIAWKNEFFNFENQLLEDMLQTLSRWYDVKIVYEDDEKKNLKFSGVLKRTSNINELLESIEKTGRVKFEITNKKIIIK